MPPLANYTQLKAKVPPSASTSDKNPTSPSHVSSSLKRKIMSSASTALMPHAKMAKPTGTSTAIVHSSGPSRPTAATTTAGQSQPSWNPHLYLRKAHRFTEEETNWLVSHIQKPSVYQLLQNPGLLKYRVYEYIAEEFNTRFHPVELTPRQVTSKIAQIKKSFVQADYLRTKFKLSRVPKEQRKTLITATCPFYFELEKMWATCWGTTVMRSDDSHTDESDSESGDEAEEESEAIGETEEDTEQQSHIQDREQKVLLGRGDRVPSTQNRQSSSKPLAQEIQRRRSQEQHRPLEQQKEERQEEQEQLPRATKEDKDTKDSIQREVAKNQHCVSRVSGPSLELKLEIMKRKLGTRTIKDQTDLALASEKLDLEAKVLVLERQRLVLQVQSHTKRLAEIQAQQDKFGGALADFKEKYGFVNETVARMDALMDRALRR